MNKQRRTFSAEFKREAAALVLDQGLQPYGGLPFAGRRGLGITPLGETTPRRAPGRYPKEQSADTRATEDPGARGQDQSAGAGESDIKKGYRSLDVGRTRSYALIDQLSEQEPVEVVCSAFDVAGRAITPIAFDGTVSMFVVLRCVVGSPVESTADSCLSCRRNSLAR